MCAYESRTCQTFRFLWVECVCVNKSRTRSVTNCTSHERVRPSGPYELQNCMSHELLESRKCQTLRFVSKEPEAEKALYKWNVCVYMGHQLLESRTCQTLRFVSKEPEATKAPYESRKCTSHEQYESRTCRTLRFVSKKSPRRKRRRMVVYMSYKSV